VDISLTAEKRRGKTDKVNEPGAHKAATPEELHCTPILRTLVMIANINPGGQRFQPLANSQIDAAASIVAGQHALGHIAIIAVNGFTFFKPVHV